LPTNRPVYASARGTCSLKRLFDMMENAVIDTSLCVPDLPPTVST
jgi:hypothetical protein